MRKLLHALVAVLFAALALAGCGARPDFYTYMCVSEQDEHSFSMRYETCNGTKEYELRVPRDGTLAVRVEIETDGGALSVTIARDGCEPVYTGNEIPTGSFTVYLKEAGTYTVQIRAKNHAGGFSFDWGE